MIRAALQKLVDWFVSWLGDLVAFAHLYVVWLVKTVRDWMFAALPPAIGDYLNSLVVHLATLLDAVGFISWFIPVYALMGVVASTWAVVYVIRVVRWVYSAVPTVGAG